MLYISLRKLGGLRRNLLNSFAPLPSTPPLRLPRFHRSSCAYNHTTIHRFAPINQLFLLFHYLNLQKEALSMAVSAPFWTSNVYLTCSSGRQPTMARSPTGLTSQRANSKEVNLSSEITYQRSQGPSFRQKRGDFTFMSHMPARGASLPNEPGLLTCPLTIYTAQRTLIVRKLKGLEDIISFTAVHWEMLEKGLDFSCLFHHSLLMARFSCSQGGGLQDPMRIFQGTMLHLILITWISPISVSCTLRSIRNIKGASLSRFYMITSKVKL